MNKADLINAISKAADLPKKNATAAVETFCEEITKALVNGEKVSIMGFGSFEVKTRNARQGRNPQTGDVIMIKAMRVPKFNPGKALLESIG